MCHQDTRFCPLTPPPKSYNIIFETLLLDIYFNKASCASIPTNVTRYCIQTGHSTQEHHKKKTFYLNVNKL